MLHFPFKIGLGFGIVFIGITEPVPPVQVTGMENLQPVGFDEEGSAFIGRSELGDFRIAEGQRIIELHGVNRLESVAL